MMLVNLKVMNFSHTICMGNDSDNIQEAITSVIEYGVALTWTVSAWDNSSFFISHCEFY